VNTCMLLLSLREFRVVYLSGNFEGDGNDVVIAKLVESGYFAFHDVETLQILNSQIRNKM